MVSYQPTAGGLLTGKHARDKPITGTRFEFGSAAARYEAGYWRDREFDSGAALAAVAAETGISLTAMAVARVLENPVVSAPIFGASRPEQLADPLAAAEVTLHPDLLARLNDMTHEYRLGDAPN